MAKKYKKGDKVIYTNSLGDKHEGEIIDLDIDDRLTTYKVRVKHWVAWVYSSQLEVSNIVSE